MKKLKLFTLAGLLVAALATPSFAADKEAKEKTIKGEAKCAKCSLHTSDKCQTVIESTSKSGKKVTYYLADNDTAKNFHEQVCKGSKEVKATGTVKTVDGKKELTVSKIEEAK